MNPNELVGQRVDRYKILQHLARGGMADVYLAEDVELQRKVALKVMLATLAQEDEFVQRFRREARAVARLDYPGIVQVYGTGLTSTYQPYIAMQYIEGGSLRDILTQLVERGKLLPTVQTLGIARQVALALGAAHEAGIVHRDVKPSNILIRPDGIPVLVDLGVAAVGGGAKLTRTGSLIGTPHYMSPEQVRGLPLDGRCDLYSLGIILYELLAGVRPFNAEESIAILHKHVYEEAIPLAKIRTGLAPETLQVIQIAMQKEPAHRYQKAAEMVAALERAMQAEGAVEPARQTTVWLPQEGDDDLISRRRVIRLPTQVRLPLKTAWTLAIAVPVVVIAAFLTMTLSLPPPTPPPATAGVVTTPAAELPVQAVVATSTLQPSATPTHTPLPTPTPTATVPPTPDLGPETLVIGRSAREVPIEAIRFGVGRRAVLLIGGLHAGYAPGSVSLAQRAVTHFSANPQDIPAGVALYIIPSASPDTPYDPGRLAGRLNANGVDLNRNWDCRWEQDAEVFGNTVPGSGGPRPFSEPETESLRSFIETTEPVAVVFWDARAADGLVSPGGCMKEQSVSWPLAETYGRAAGYRVEDFEEVGASVSGDGSNWLDQQGVPSAAVLLPDFTGPDWENNLAAMLAVLLMAGMPDGQAPSTGPEGAVIPDM